MAIEPETDIRGVSYGDVISLFTQTADMDGHLRADGFIDDTVSIALSEDGTIPRHFDECLFQIVPRLKYAKKSAKREDGSPAAADPGSPPSPSTGQFAEDASRSGTSVQKFKNPMAEQFSILHSMENGAAPPASPVSAMRRSTSSEEERVMQKYDLLNDELERQYEGSALKFGSYVQLRHVKSGRFVTIRPRLVAQRERDSMQISLQDGSEDASFVLKPKFKLRKDGSTIHWNDECIFSNLIHGLSLHCSKYRVVSRRGDKTLDDEETPSRYAECNASPRLTGWRFKLYSSYAISSKALPKALRSGDVVRLQHAESQGYICCEGFSLDTVHVRVAANDSQREIEEHHVGQLWKVEMGSADVGGLATFTKSLRFKHVASGRYLCVSQSAMSDREQPALLQSKNESLKRDLSKGSIYKLTTAVEPSQLANFFLERTTPGQDAYRDSDAVNISDFVFLRSGHGWVHTPKETEVQESGRREEWRELVGDKYFNDITPGKLGVVCIEDSATHEGAFGFVSVPKDEVQRCEQLKPIATTLDECVDRLIQMGPWAEVGADDRVADAGDESPSGFASSAGIVSPRWVTATSMAAPILHEVKAILHDVTDYLVGKASRATQKMMRELQIIDTLIKLLRHLTEGNPDVDRYATATSRHVYDILGQIAEEYHLNEFTICHMAFSPYKKGDPWTVIDHLGLSLGAEHLLAVILSHNMQLAHIVHKDTIDKVIFTFVRERRHDKMVLEFLTSLCSTNGKQVRNNQMYIGHVLLQEENRQLLVTTTIQEDRVQLSWSWPGEPLNTVWLDEVLSDDPEISAPHFDLYEFYLAQIMLFSEMCYGISVEEADGCVASFFVGDKILTMFLQILGNINAETNVEVGFRMEGTKLPTCHRARLYAEMCKLIIDRVLTSNESKAHKAQSAKVLIWPGTAAYSEGQGVGRQEYDQLKLWAVRCLTAALKSKHWLHSKNGDIASSNFVQAVLRICRKLVTLGLYGTNMKTLDDSTLDALFVLTDPLVKLLSHQNAKLLKGNNEGESRIDGQLKSAYQRAQTKQTDEEAMIQVKSEACKILSIILKIQEEYFLKRFVVKMYHETKQYNSMGTDERYRSFENPLEDGRLSTSQSKVRSSHTPDRDTSSDIRVRGQPPLSSCMSHAASEPQQTHRNGTCFRRWQNVYGPPSPRYRSPSTGSSTTPA